MSPNMPPKLTFFFFFLVAVTLHIGKWIKQMDVETASHKQQHWSLEGCSFGRTEQYDQDIFSQKPIGLSSPSFYSDLDLSNR